MSETDPLKARMEKALAANSDGVELARKLDARIVERLGKTQYSRPILPREFWPHRYAADAMVLVTILPDGVRIRSPLAYSIGLYDDHDAQFVARQIAQQASTISMDDLPEVIKKLQE